MISLRNILASKPVVSAFCGLLLASSSLFAYENPIIKGFHPDPSVCAVGGDYYLVNSSFQYFPGVPIFHSKDLINWTQIGNVLDRRSQLDLTDALSWGGIYAPTIRYNEGTFYMITTNTSHGGNFIVHTDNPAGEWSDPIYVDMPGIDPSLFFHDGKCWYTGTTDNKIVLCEIDPLTGTKLSEVKTLWNGTGGRYPEGPHLYFKDGWFYLLIAEGGTEYAHKVTIARSRSIDGPYEGNPSNPILTHCTMAAQNNPIQGVGHADFVQASDGSWWMTCLGFRTQGGNHHLLGRETFLAPVEWPEGEWPTVNGSGEIFLNMPDPVTEPADVTTHTQVSSVTSTSTSAVTSTSSVTDKVLDFSKDKCGHDWVYIRNPFMNNYSYTRKSLRLKSSGLNLDETHLSPTFIGRRQEDIFFSAVTSLTSEPKTSGGMTVFMDAGSHYDLFLEKGILYLHYRLGELSCPEAVIPLNADRVWLKVEGNEYFYIFSYSTDGENFFQVAQMNTRYLSSETASGFTGIVLGLFAGGPEGTYADFRDFSYKSL